MSTSFEVSKTSFEKTGSPGRKRSVILPRCAINLTPQVVLRVKENFRSCWESQPGTWWCRSLVLPENFGFCWTSQLGDFDELASHDYCSKLPERHQGRTISPCSLECRDGCGPGRFRDLPCPPGESGSADMMPNLRVNGPISAVHLLPARSVATMIA